MNKEQIIKRVLKELKTDGEDMINFEGHCGVWAMNRALDLYEENIQKGFICLNCIKQPDFLSLLKRIKVRKRRKK